MRRKEEWLFPLSVSPSLQSARGDQWRELTEHISTLDEEHIDSLAFGLMMIQLCGCATCQPGCYKLSLGCSTCAYRTVANIKGTDSQVLRRFQNARSQVEQFIQTESIDAVYPTSNITIAVAGD
jgi:hypothetical protein